MSAQPACPGVKGHGYVNVPGAWYDLSSRLDAVRAVLYWVNETLPSLDGMQEFQRDSINRAASLSVAAENLLDLCHQDLERLERDLKAA